jgi:hypothetical protein
MAKLLLITSDDDNTIDQVLMLVPDDYDHKFALRQASDAGIRQPTIAEEFEVESKYSDLAEYRAFVG